MNDTRFGKESRLRRGSEFQRVFAGRQSAADDVLIVYGLRNELPRARLGLSVSRKVGGAVVRNRWKRVIREAFRLNRAELPSGVDLVVVPRPSAEPEFAAVQRSLCQLAGRVARKLTRNTR